MRSLLSLVVAIIAVAALVAPAAAQEPEPGLFIDPDSPSAKEYALPLEDERRQADPGTAPEAGVQPGQRTSPAFGAGVTEEEAGGASAAANGGEDASDGGGADAGGASGAGDDAGSPAGDAGDADDAETIRQATAQPGAPDDGIGGSLVVGGIALAVLAVAGAAGLVLRRRGAA